jgi:hypothetical protein
MGPSLFVLQPCGDSNIFLTYVKDNFRRKRATLIPCFFTGKVARATFLLVICFGGGVLDFFLGEFVAYQKRAEDASPEGVAFGIHVEAVEIEEVTFDFAAGVEHGFYDADVGEGFVGVAGGVHEVVGFDGFGPERFA